MKRIKHLLNCLSLEVKQPYLFHACLANNLTEQIPLLDFKLYSSFSTLKNITKYFFKWLCLRKGSRAHDKALVYQIKTSQSESFLLELQYLQGETQASVPPLVSQLNLLIDNKGLIRSRGRLSRSLYFDYKVLNLILLEKTLFDKTPHNRLS